MKKTKLISLTATITFSALVAILYSSCTKVQDTCKGTICQNSGACINGTCSCPTGYTGQFCEQSIIIYVNNTFTPVILTANNTISRLQPGGFLSIVGMAGSSVSVSANTCVMTPTGKRVGDNVTWSFTDQFPVNGARFTHPLYISPSYFLLNVANGDYSDSVVALKVNYGTAFETTDSLLLPNDGTPRVIGYYQAQPGIQVLALSNKTGFSWIMKPQIPSNTQNASVTVSVP